ncbi:YhgE/Pip domain-containing protein [Paenibacillus sp. LHD-38]|uniref:YhgE/Pip domain-containing protein n=1 Tax=Paenibacillus sp. LHD-38 TaxID=3072143 RepID=UPI00280DC1B4|nr:YhgE/Pip domain-containing protein [Paenibacillus sp. LHD-38]MDQ8738320.1 YhgE/Pip domain-containing protein [Paenibacillus sp. LHD-38]
MKFRGLKQFGEELSGIARNKMLLISVIGVLMIPLMYSSMFLGAFWDPYGHLDKMPVAIVNADKGYEYNDEMLHIGDDFEEQLKENETFEWHFVSKEEAEAGIEDHSYYMAIEIPSDFSEKTTSLTSDNPTPAQLTYLANESYNFLASQIGSKVVDTMKVELGQEVTAAYTRTVFDQMEELVDGIGQASDGAGEIADGTTKAKDGAVLIEQNLAKLVSGSLTLQEGVAKLNDGGAALGKGSAELSAGTSSLASGLAQLQAAQQQLGAGAASLGDGAGSLGAGALKLSDGLQQLAEASGQLAEGALDAQQAAGQLAGGLKESASGEEQLKVGAAQLAIGLAQLGQANPELAESESFASLLKASRELAAGLEKSSAGQTQLSDGAGKLNEGLVKVSDGLGAFDKKAQEAAAAGKQLGAGGEQVVAGAEKFSGGMTQFGAKLTEASGGASKLAAGAKQLNDGATTLTAGLSQLSANVTPFVDGSVKLEDGAQQVASGLLKLEDGTQELSGKLGEASDKTADLKLTDSMVDMFSDPVKLDVEKITKVDNYGTGLAPYFLSLGLFVGAMLLTIVYSVREPAVRPVNGWSWFWSKALTLSLIGVIQALIADAALLFVLKLEVQSVGLFLFYSILTSITFMMIIQFLVASMGNPGRFIAVILLIFQLTSSAGTFPIELVPGWLQKISPFLPMTYAVAGFRDIVSSGDYSLMGRYVATLGGIALLFAVLSYLYFTLSHRKMKSDSVAEQPATAAV